MDATTMMILGLGGVAAVAWALVCWSGERFFRTFIAISVVLHAVLFVVPFSTGLGTPIEPAGPRLLPLTFVQGADAPAVEVSAVVAADEPVPNEVPRLDEQPVAETPAGEELVPKPDAAQPEPGGVVDAGLPEIERTELFDFDKHPGRDSYRRELQRTIQRLFEVPPELAGEQYEGRVRVRLTLERDGTIRDVEIDPTMCSENERINRLTLDNVRKLAGAIPPLPDNVRDEAVRFNVIIDYRIFRNR